MLIKRENPWLGLEAYKENQIIYGRDAEICDLVHSILYKKDTVLYGKSGIGKTSVINAGILPKVRENGFCPILIRFNHDSTSSYVEQLVACIRKEIDVKEIIPVKDINHLSCWEFFHGNHFLVKGKRVKLLLIFDQFEEMFTLQNDTKLCVSFFKDFGYVLNNIKPKELENLVEYNDVSITDIQQEVDSFDELFDLSNGFCQENELAYTPYIEDNEIHFVFVLREDFLSDFEYYTAKIPSLKQNRFGLRPLNEEQAAEIIIKPCPGLVSMDVAHLIIEKVTGRNDFSLGDEPEIEVDAAVLSLFLSRIYQKLHDCDNVISSNLIKQSGHEIIKNFYTESIVGLSDNEINYLENRLLTSNGRRNNVSFSDFCQLVKEEKVKDLIWNKKLLRTFNYGKDIRLELIHDVLCPTVREHKEQREQLRRIEEIKEIEEKKRKILLEEQEKEEKRRKEYRKEKNLKKKLQSQNVLSLRGRRIWDNKTFSFSVDNTYSNTFQNSSERLDSGIAKINDALQSDTSNLFLEQLLEQFANIDSLLIDFQGNQSKDGISEFQIDTCICNEKRKIRNIFFYNSAQLQGNNKNMDFYTKDGFHGITLHYDEFGRERKREYMCDGYTALGISSVEFSYNTDGFPISATYYDKNNNPCKHLDGNYGVLMEYDEFGNEIKRWFVNEYGKKTRIYNEISGVFSQYDSQDRLICQYFVSENGERIFDIFGFHGVRYEYLQDKNITKIYHINLDGKIQNNPDRYCLEVDITNNKNIVIEQKYYKYLENNYVPVNRKDGSFEYFKVSIAYDLLERPNILTLSNFSNEVVKNIECEYYPNGFIAKVYFRGVHNNENYYSLPEDGVFVRTFEYTKQGFIRMQSHWDDNGNSIQDTNGIHSAVFEYDDVGRRQKASFFKNSTSLAEEETTYSYYADGKCKVTTLKYSINEQKLSLKDSLNRLKNKQLFKKSYRTLESTESMLGRLNSRFEFIERFFDANNDFIEGIPLSVQFRYNDNGDIIEQRLFHLDTLKPICNNDGEYGWKIELNESEKRTQRIVSSLDENFNITNNKQGYAIEINTNNKESKYTTTKYIDKCEKPVIHRTLGYHKCVEIPILGNEESYKTIEFFDCNDNPIDCASGYSTQKCEVINLNDSELLIEISFLDAEGQPVINKDLGYHKCTEVHSHGYITELAFWDTNNHLILSKYGFAKRKIKQKKQYSTFFYYPFCDHCIIRYYDGNDNKINVTDSDSLGNQYNAYKFIKSLSSDCIFATYDANSKRNYIKNRFDWKCFNVIIIPIFTLIFAFAYILYWPFPNLISFINKIFIKHKKCSVIVISELNDSDNGICPLKQYGIKPGTWIIKWNEWIFTIDENIATYFEQEFNKKEKAKKLLLYNPNETDTSNRFREINYFGDRLGARIMETDVDKGDVDKMLHLLSKRGSTKVDSQIK